MFIRKQTMQVNEQESERGKALLAIDDKFFAFAVANDD